MRTAVIVLVAVVFSGCSAIKRDKACVDAETCDNALQTPFGGFDAKDPVFGDDLDGKAGNAGVFGNVGTCWQSADTAKPCIDQCKQFVKDQNALAVANNDQGALAACPGDAAAEGEGEGEGGQ